MSSKSRQKQPKPNAPKPAAAGEAGAESGSTTSQDSEEIIHAPRDSNPVRFMLIILLLIVLLIIFVVPQALQGTVSGDPGEETALTWEHPTEGTQTLSFREFQNERRAWGDFLGTLRGNVRLTEPEIASLIIVDALAEANGVAIAPSELQTFIRERILPAYGGSVAAYEQAVGRRRGSSIREYENTCARFLRAERYQNILAQFGGQLEPTVVEEAWAEQHQEYNFDYVQLVVADLVEAARAENPSDETLEEWLNGLSPVDSLEFQEPQKSSAAQMRVRLGEEFDSTALLAKYPAPEDADADERGRDYYAFASSARFVNPRPEEGPPPPDWTFLKPYDEVAEQAKEEATVYFALQDLVTDLVEREAAGETIDLAAEAAAFGLAHDAGGEPRSYEDWVELEDWGGQVFASRVNRDPVGKLITSPVVTKDALAIALVQERVPPALPPLADIRDEVFEKWAQGRAEESAETSLNEVRDGLKNAVAVDETALEAEAASFQAVAESAGFTTATSEWYDKAARGDLRGAQDAPPFQDFIIGRFPAFELEPGQVDDVAFDGARERAYLVRCAGVRPVSLEKMKPMDLQRIQSQEGFTTRREFLTESLGIMLNRNFGIIPSMDGSSTDVAVLERNFGVRFAEGVIPDRGEGEGGEEPAEGEEG